MKLEIVYDDQSVVTLAEKPAARIPVRYFVLRDWERTDWTGECERNSLPQVRRLGEYANPNNGHYTRLNREWQFFWFDLCSFVVYGRYHSQLTKEEYRWLANRWTGVGGTGIAFMNKHGLDAYRNYVLNVRMDYELPAIYTITGGGASLGGVEVDDRLKVDHFDGTKPPPDVRTIDPYTDPRVFFANSIGTRADRSLMVYRFAQFGGKDVPVPIVASRDIYYLLKDLERYESAYKRNPYYPP